MSGPYHERAVCGCGWTGTCTFGNLFHLSHRGRFINVCPDCGEPKSKMRVRVLRWHNGTWRDREDQPYDGKESGPSEPTPLIERWWFSLLMMILISGALTWLVIDMIGRLVVMSP